MKQYKLLFLAALLLAGTIFTACIRDNSVLGGQPISVIKFADSLKGNYSVDKFETLIITVPRIIQTNADKPLTYEWEIDYKKVGTGETLKYECRSLGTFNCRLKVSNEDGATFHLFSLFVKSPYQEGVMVMSSYKDKAMFSFKREDIADKPFYKHVYADNNPGIPLGNTPVSVVQHEKMLYFATNNPARIVKVDEKTMEALLILDYEGTKVTDMKGSKYSYDFTIMNDAICYDYETQQDMFMSFTMPSLKQVAPNVALSGKMLYVYDGGFTSYPYFYDNNQGQLLTLISYQPKKVEDSRLQGKEFVSMMPCNNEKDILLVLKDKATGELYLAHYIHETFTVQSVKKLPSKEIDGSSVFIAAQKDPLFYYSIGNKLYVHNYLSNNFSDTPLYTVGTADDKIAALLFSPQQDKLYIGLNRKTGDDYRGDVLCFDAAKQTQLWHEKSVAGDIVFMGYKK